MDFSKNKSLKHTVSLVFHPPKWREMRGLAMTCLRACFPRKVAWILVAVLSRSCSSASPSCSSCFSFARSAFIRSACLLERATIGPVGFTFARSTHVRASGSLQAQNVAYRKLPEAMNFKRERKPSPRPSSIPKIGKIHRFN